MDSGRGFASLAAAPRKALLPITPIRMIARHAYKNLVWVDLERPTAEEARKLMTEFNLHPLVAEELVDPTIRPKVEMHSGYIYLILHFPTVRRLRHKKEIEQQEVDFIIGKNFIITSRYDIVDPLHRFAKLFEVNSILERDGNGIGDHAGFLFFYMVSHLYTSLLREIETLNDSIQDIETRIFKGEEREMVMQISNVSRELLDFKRAINLHREVLASFEIAGRRFFGEDFNYYLKAISGEYYKVDNAARSSSELIAELRDTNNSLVSTKQNETMRILTIAAFLTLPASVVTSFFQIGARHMPIVGLPDDWAIILGISLATTLLLFAIAKAKKWF